MVLLSIFLLFFSRQASAQEPPAPWISSSTMLPTYVSLAPNINDFGRFADGGSDANWYVGFNNAWILKLPAAPLGEYSRAFVGAKIGRAKTFPNPNKPWVREIIDGKVYVGLSPTPSFSAEQSYFLAETADIPLETDGQAYVEGSGSSEWFWAEVPVSAVNFSGPNYLVIWSPTKYFLRASSAPILAASPIDNPALMKETRAWNNHSISGVPPRVAATALETPINNIIPALAIKLVPPLSDEINVTELAAQSVGKKYVVTFSVGGENVAEAWVESSKDQLDWARVSKILRKPPYIFTITGDRFPSPGEYLRGAARDITGTVGKSEAYGISFPAR